MIFSRFFSGSYQKIYDLVFLNNGENPKYIAIGAILAIMVVPAINLVPKLLFPSTKNRNLVNYPGYEKLKLTVYWGVGWNILCSIIIILTQAKIVFLQRPDSITISCFISSLVCIATLYLAANKLRQDLEKVESSA